MRREDQIVRFGVFEVHLHSGELRKNGVRLKLQDQPFRVLSVLLERPGNVVTREELYGRLWPDGTFVDFDHSLNASVNKLREALADTDPNNRLIETVPRRGYRFTAPVELSQPMPSHRRIPANSMALVVTAVVAIAVGIVIWFTRSGPPVLADAVPLTSAPGLELQPSFSPDGNQIAYSGGPGGVGASDVFVKQIGSDSLRRLTSHPDPEVSPKWSPDGRHIAFVRLSGEDEVVEAAVLIVPVLGGPERKVASIRVSIRHTSLVEWLLDWFPDSETIAFADRGEKGDPYSLFAVNTRSGERWRLTSSPAMLQGDLDPAVSPDGRKLAFARGIPVGGEIQLLELNREYRPIGEPRPLTSGNQSRGPVWTPDGQEILFAFGPQHRKRLHRMRASVGSRSEPVPYAAEGTYPLSAALSRRWQLAYPAYKADADIYRTELAPSGEGVRTTVFLKSTFVEHQPVYSPDGKRIAFASNRTGSQQIWLADAEGQNAHHLTSLPATSEPGAPRWAPDGTRIAFSAGPDTYVVSADGGPPSLWLKDAVTPEWSRDGKWIYFASTETGRREIWRSDAAASGGRTGRVQVTRNGGIVPRISPEGKSLYFLKGVLPAEVWRCPIDGGEEVRVIDRISNTSAYELSGEDIFYIPPQIGGALTDLMVFNTKSSARKVVAHISGHPLWGLSISPDRRHVLSVHEREGEADLMYVDRFR